MTASVVIPKNKILFACRHLHRAIIIGPNLHPAEVTTQVKSTNIFPNNANSYCSYRKIKLKEIDSALPGCITYLLICVLCLWLCDVWKGVECLRDEKMHKN